MISSVDFHKITTNYGEVIPSGIKVPHRVFHEGSNGPDDPGGPIEVRASIVQVEVTELEPPEELVKLGRREPGWQISVNPWLAPVHQHTETGSKEREMLVWVCPCPISIRFETPGHFYETNPFSLGTELIEDLDNAKLQERWNFYACSGPVKTAVPVRLGPFKYTIDIFPKPNVKLTIDPEYVVEKDGKAP